MARRMLVVGMYVGLDLASSLWWQFGMPVESGAFFFRSAFLLITTMLAGYLREQARTAEHALAYQLHQASTLNESTQALSASLDLAVVTNSIAEAVRRLTDAGKVMLQLGPPYQRIVVSSACSKAHQQQRQSRCDHRAAARRFTSSRQLILARQSRCARRSWWMDTIV